MLIKITMCHHMEGLCSHGCGQVLLGKEMNIWVMRVLSLGVRRTAVLNHKSTCQGETIQEPGRIPDGTTCLIIGPGNGILLGTGTVTGMETEDGTE
jgi:hypothetical protein